MVHPLTSTNRVSPSGKSYKPNSNKSTHPANLGEIPPVVKKLHPSENADKTSQNPDKGMQPDGKTPAGASATSYHKNIKVPYY
jgi:hypothetical protein